VLELHCYEWRSLDSILTSSWKESEHERQRMKAFLLAAGHGTRLSPLTDSVPKCLLPIRGVPMLDLWLALLAGYGVDEVLINLHAHANVVRDHFAQSSPPVRLRLEEEPVLLGSAGTLRRHQTWVAGEAAVWVCYADVLTNCDLAQIKNQHESSRQLATLGLYSVPDPQRCGIAEIEGDRILNFQEKPEVPPSNLAFSGIMLLNPAAISMIPQEKTPADIGFDLLPRLSGKMSYTILEDYLLDIGTKQNFALAQETWPGLSLSGMRDVGGSAHS